MISVEEALSRILAAVEPLCAEQVFLDDTLGRALAEAVISQRTLPPWDNSAMDGYAVRAAEVRVGEPLPVAGTVAAGAEPGTLAPGTSVKIMTGAPLPDFADAVIMREQASEEDAPAAGARQVRFQIAPTVGAHLRRAGEDVRAGEQVLAAGLTVGAGELGLCAAIGRTVLRCGRRPTVAILSTGDELVEPDRAPGRGQIVGSNAYALAALCRQAGALPTVLPIAGDERAVIRAAFAHALRADVVISSGGVSVGDFDFVKEALEDLGVKQDFWKVAMKPGKPIAFGTRDGRPVFGLPGNPASSMVGFELFVRPALRKMAGFAELSRPRAEVILDEPHGQEPGRRHYMRARLRREGGALHAQPLGRQGSGMLRSMVGMNALVEVPDGAGRVEAGATLTALLLEAV